MVFNACLQVWLESFGGGPFKQWCHSYSSSNRRCHSKCVCVTSYSVIPIEQELLRVCHSLAETENIKSNLAVCQDWHFYVHCIAMESVLAHSFDTHCLEIVFHKIVNIFFSIGNTAVKFPTHTLNDIVYWMIIRKNVEGLLQAILCDMIIFESRQICRNKHYSYK